MKKAELRKIYLQKRQQLSESDFILLNQKIADQFKLLDLSGVKLLHIFLPIIEKHEIDTYFIINWLLINHPEIKIAVPKSNFSNLTLTHLLYNKHLTIEKNKWNIPEPVSGDRIDPSEIDLVMVPLLAVDRKGYRVGYGKGFYDRFLAECRKDVQLIGLSQFNAIESIEDTDEYDIKLQKCITPTEMFRF